MGDGVASFQCGVLFQIQVAAWFEEERACKISACRHHDDSATIGMTTVYDFLNLLGLNDG